MTLCKYRPQRTYDEQYIIEGFDADGLLKMLHEKVTELGVDGDARVMCYIGALTTLQTMFKFARTDGMIDYPHEFMKMLDRAFDEYEKGSE